MHEYEAYLFVDISTLSLYYEGQEHAIGKLENIADRVGSPELIDDGRDSAPSKRIIAHLPQYRHDKATVGVQAVQCFGLSRIRCGCPHFSRWMDRLEALAA